MASFGDWLGTAMRQRRILSIARLARESGLPAEQVGDWLLDRNRPSIDEAARLAKYLGLNVDVVDQAAGIRPGERSERRPA